MPPGPLEFPPTPPITVAYALAMPDAFAFVALDVAVAFPPVPPTPPLPPGVPVPGVPALPPAPPIAIEPVVSVPAVFKLTVAVALPPAPPAPPAPPGEAPPAPPLPPTPPAPPVAMDLLFVSTTLPEFVAVALSPGPPAPPATPALPLEPAVPGAPVWVTSTIFYPLLTVKVRRSCCEAKGGRAATGGNAIQPRRRVFASYSVFIETLKQIGAANQEQSWPR